MRYIECDERDMPRMFLPLSESCRQVRGSSGPFGGLTRELWAERMFSQYAAPDARRYRDK